MILNTEILQNAVQEWETDPAIRERFVDVRQYADYLHCPLLGVARYRVVKHFIRKTPGYPQRTCSPGDFLTLPVIEAQERVERGEVEIPVKKTLRP